MKIGQSTLESWMLANGKEGDIFYTHKKDKDVTAISTYYKRKITTERLLIISGSKDSPQVSSITKITIKH